MLQKHCWRSMDSKVALTLYSTNVAQAASATLNRVNKEQVTKVAKAEK